ncbi:hypothetical protein UFOVP257_41 [uncultured Caudovirales phage]|uniref:LT_GEWL domain containing protein n=1 Tax=uncultured Caudovirales phage TaxID=2100421 RepID=A0A6J5LEQ7_9CAUD|nr:hypothetical protein UFOVP257_41 [uncultured Caudovirales phage]
MRSKDIVPNKKHPVQEDWQDVKNFGKEVGSGVVDIGKGAVDLAVAAGKDFVDPESYKRDWETVKRGAKFATDDPIGAAKYAARSTDDFGRAMANQATFGGADYADAFGRKYIYGDSNLDKHVWNKYQSQQKAAHGDKFKPEPWTGSYDQYKKVQDIWSDEAAQRSPTATAMGDVGGTLLSLPFTGGARAGVSLVAKGAQNLGKIPKVGKILKPAAEIGAGTVGGVAAEKGTGKAVRKIDPDNPYIPDQTNEGTRNPFRRAPAPAPAPSTPHTAPATPHTPAPVDLNSIPPSSSVTRRQWKRMSTADRQAEWDKHTAASAPAPAEPPSEPGILDKAGELRDKWNQFRYKTTDPLEIEKIKQERNITRNTKGGGGDKENKGITNTAWNILKSPVPNIVGGLGLYGAYKTAQDYSNASPEERKKWTYSDVGADVIKHGADAGMGMLSRLNPLSDEPWHPPGVKPSPEEKPADSSGGNTTPSTTTEPTVNPTEPGSSNVPGERLEPARNRYTRNTVPEIPADASPQREAAGDNNSQDAENAAVAQFLRNMVRRESGGKNIENKTGSKAYGLFQFMPGTFKGLVAKATPDSPLYKKTWNEFKQDVNLQKDAMKVITKDYLNSLHKSKLQVTPAALYMLHYFGPTGIKMMNSDPNLTLDKIFKPTKNELTGKLEPNIVFKQNPNLKPHETVSALYGKLHAAMQDSKPTTGTRVATAPANTTVPKGKKLKDKATDILATVVGAKSASAEELPSKKVKAGGAAKPATVADKIDNKEKSASDTEVPDTSVKAKSSTSDAEKTRRSQDMARKNADTIAASNKVQAAQKAHLAGTDIEKTPDELDRSKYGGTIGGKAYEPNPPSVPKIDDVSKVLQKSYANSEEPVSKPIVTKLPSIEPVEEPKSAWDKGIETMTGKPRLSQKELRTVQVPESINTELQDILKLAGKR